MMIIDNMGLPRLALKVHMGSFTDATEVYIEIYKHIFIAKIKYAICKVKGRESKVGVRAENTV